MSAIKELLREEADGTLSFGDYTLAEKKKKSDFAYRGDVYKVKTFREMTKLEKNEGFFYESVPGTAVTELKAGDDEMSFTVEGNEDAQITLGLKDHTAYRITIDGEDAGVVETGMGGKLSFSVELENAEKVAVAVALAE